MSAKFDAQQGAFGRCRVRRELRADGRFTAVGKMPRRGEQIACSSCSVTFKNYYHDKKVLCKKCRKSSDNTVSGGSGSGSSKNKPFTQPFASTAADIAYTDGTCFVQSISAMPEYSSLSFEELRYAYYRKVPSVSKQRPPDQFVGVGFCDALELRRLRKHRVALTLRAGADGTVGAIVHVRPTEPLLPSPAQPEQSPTMHAQREAHEPTIVWENAWEEGFKPKWKTKVRTRWTSTTCSRA